VVPPTGANGRSHNGTKLIGNTFPGPNIFLNAGPDPYAVLYANSVALLGKTSANLLFDAHSLELLRNAIAPMVNQNGTPISVSNFNDTYLWLKQTTLFDVIKNTPSSNGLLLLRSVLSNIPYGNGSAAASPAPVIASTKTTSNEGYNYVTIGQIGSAMDGLLPDRGDNFNQGQPESGAQSASNSGNVAIAGYLADGTYIGSVGLPAGVGAILPGLDLTSLQYLGNQYPA
jgi:hypothetical protein